MVTTDDRAVINLAYRYCRVAEWEPPLDETGIAEDLLAYLTRIIAFKRHYKTQQEILGLRTVRICMREWKGNK